MMRKSGVTVLLGALMACGGDYGSAPSPTPTGLKVVFFPDGTPYIGKVLQFQLNETLTNGTTRAVSGASRGSDNTAVATLSSTGVVTGVKAGEATIYADANGRRGTLQISVYLNFNGEWSGSEIQTGCTDSGVFEGTCKEFPNGERFSHQSVYEQNEGTVEATIDGGEDVVFEATGTISIGGELRLPSTPGSSPEPSINVQIENWRTRSDTPDEMTGRYEVLFTSPGLNGNFRLMLRLEDLAKDDHFEFSVPSTRGRPLDVARLAAARVRKAS